MIASKELWSVPSSSGAAPNGGRAVGNGANSYAFMASNASAMMQQLQNATSAGMSSVALPHDRSLEICKYYVNGGCLRGGNCPYLHELPDERHLDVNGLGFILNPNVHNAQKTVAAPQVGLVPPQGGQLSPNSQGSPMALALSGQPQQPQSQPGPGAGGRTFHFGKGPKPPHFNALASTSAVPAPMMMTPKLQPPPRYRPPEPYLEHNLPPVLALPLKSSPKEVAQALSRGILQS